MGVKELKRKAMHSLTPVYGERESVNIIRVLHEDLLGPKSAAVTEIESARWLDAIQRLMDHEPLSYITGISHFFNLKLSVGPGVLIPRPETEELTSGVIQYATKLPQPKILDLGTGSGCIALAIKSACPSGEVHAMDISEAALIIARENAARLKLVIHFQQADLLDELSWSGLPDQLDILVSNPPYIATREMDLMSESVLKYEPSEALFAGEDDLIFYKYIARFGKSHLKPDGKFFVEINEFSGMRTADVFEKHDYAGIQLLKDLSGKDRFVIGRNP